MQFNILYIEDDTLTRNFTATLLRKHCHNLILAKDGLEGFIKFKSEPIDLIITDLSMPNMNGAEFIKMIRDINQEIPIIIHSIHVGSDILTDCINYGIQAYIKKPITNKALHDKISEIKHQKYEERLTQECH